MDRKQFLGLQSKASPAPTNVNVIKKVGRRTSTALNKYTGTWGVSEVKHLLSRTLFGYKKSELTAFLSKNLDTAVADILNVGSTAPDPPLNHYGIAGNVDPDVPLGQTWINAPLSGAANFNRIVSMKIWWHKLMINQAPTIREKMTIFWHSHFATESDTIVDVRLVYEYQRMLRENALGNFKDLTKKVTLDGGMLVYLNGNKNTKTAPDENYGRELQELFCLGKGPDSKYTEDDVKAAAKVLTGWRVNQGVNPAVVGFSASEHDTGDKQFSSFFNNTKITGRSGATAGNLELDDMLTMIFNQDEVAKYICRKLYRYFVYYEIDADTETNVILPLATHFRNNGYDIKSVLEKLLLSEHFFDIANRGCIIKSPLDHLCGFAKNSEIAFPDPTNKGVNVEYNHYAFFLIYSQLLGMYVADPPNVAGWPAWYQAPQFHEIWINSDTLPKRNQITDYLLYSGYTKDGYTLVANLMDMAERISSDPKTADTLVADALEYLLPLPATAGMKAYIKSLLLTGGIPDYNWTDAWNKWKSTPSDTANKNTVTYLLLLMFKGIMNLEEYQLS